MDDDGEDGIYSAPCSTAFMPSNQPMEIKLLLSCLNAVSSALKYAMLCDAATEGLSDGRVHCSRQG
eukprot:11607-Eustigmatos_ZCMA.PRE.1